MKKFLQCIVVLFSQYTLAQQDSIMVSAQLSNDQKTLSVQQEIIYYNHHQFDLTQIKLQNWIAAYNSRKTHLLSRKLQDRKKDLYFAKADQLGYLKQLSYQLAEDSVVVSGLEHENIYVPLQQPLKPNETVKLTLKYELSLPDYQFTKYGTTEGKVALKYFFITPDRFEDNQQSPNYFIDIEQNVTAGYFWDIKLSLPPNWNAESNLEKTSPYHFEGISITDPELLLSENQYDQFRFNIEGKPILIQLGYAVTKAEKESLEFYLPLHLQFLADKLGTLPAKLLITEKFKDREKFIGIDDVKFWKFHYQLFTDAEKIDLNYFSILTKSCLNNTIITDKIKDHWLKNGLKTYLEIQYLKANYADHKLLGDLPNQAKLFGLKPLKIFFASDVKLLDRYGLAYQYIQNQNLDQRIDLDYEKLSNFNTTAISHFETGILFNYISEKIGPTQFETFVKTYVNNQKNEVTSGQHFLHELDRFTKNESAFLTPMMQHKNRINFKLKNFKKSEEKTVVKIVENTDLEIPFKLELEQEDGQRLKKWLVAKSNNSDYEMDLTNTEKIMVNDDFSFPETTYRDNYIYTKGVFANMKKLKLKLIKDIPNPEFNEIYVMPKASFNAYDKVLLGVNFINKGLFDQKLIYSLTPYYSTGTNQLTGSGAVSYTILPAHSFYRSWTFSASSSYFHYDFDLSYRRFNLATSINFNKDPRSAIGRNLYFSYGYFEKDLDEKRVIANEYGKYNIWNVGYTYSDNAMIHEKSINGNIQGMEDFMKLSTEAYYRWEYAKDKKISFRFFAGYFLKNHAKNSSFDYGISKVNNYTFSYGLLGQSATSGLFSQQFILAEGGFKSLFNTKVNHWLTSVNVDSHIWKMFNIYADAGLYDTKNSSSKFIWDSGIKLRVIPDFLEIYFPVQSSLGFEPAMKDYGYRIRYTLVFNLNSLIGNLRRGVY